MRTICARLDFNHKIGGGHLKRFLNLYKSIKINSKKILVIQTQKKYHRTIKNLSDKNIKIFFLEKFADNKEFELLKKLNADHENITFIFDLCNRLKLKNKKILFKYFKDIHFLNKIFLIDSTYKEKIINRINKKFINGIITPYLENKVFKYKNHFYGLKYFIFDPSAKIGNKNIKEIKKILISFGNSDPKNISKFVLENIVRLDHQKDINVVIGPLFKNQLIIDLKRLQENNIFHNIKLLNNKNKISDQLNWCDLAIVSCGLTKYETILHKKPSIIIPIDRNSKMQAKILRKKNLIYLSNSFERLNSSQFQKILNVVLNDKKSIYKIIKNCKKLNLDNKNHKFLKLINFK